MEQFRRMQGEKEAPKASPSALTPTTVTPPKAQESSATPSLMQQAMRDTVARPVATNKMPNLPPLPSVVLPKSEPKKEEQDWYKSALERAKLIAQTLSKEGTSKDSYSRLRKEAQPVFSGATSQVEQLKAGATLPGPSEVKPDPEPVKMEVKTEGNYHDAANVN